jgi:molybdate transport system ATP-binding protein
MRSRAASAAAPGEAPGLHVRLAQDGPIPLAAALAAAAGQVLALVGPSGSGKSTILRAIAGHYRPRHGRVTVNGAVWFDSIAGICLAAHRRRAGLVFQSYALFPHMSALANVAAALAHLPPRSRPERARSLLDQVHLSGLEDRRPGELSGGQQQRVAVARALARDPDVLLLDEPFSAVDKSTRQKLYQELAAMRRRLAMPVVLVTHDLDEALLLADRLNLLHGGRTLQEGTPAEVMARPVSVEAARLVGLRNIFEAEIAEPPPAAADGGLLRWRGRLLKVRHPPTARPGATVRWVVPPEGVVLHRRDRPSRGERENPFHGVVGGFVVLGAEAQITLLIDGDVGAALGFSVPTHVARRNGIDRGETIGVSLLAEAIHVFPEEPPEATAQRADSFE